MADERLGEEEEEEEETRYYSAVVAVEDSRAAAIGYVSAAARILQNARNALSAMEAKLTAVYRILISISTQTIL